MTAENRYPALARAIVVDSRFSTRSELLRTLKGLGLFDSIVEAGSVQDGLLIVSSEPADLCIVGASVSTTTACDFLTRAQECRHSKDCAFVAIARGDAESARALWESGAQRVLGCPYSRAQLFDAVIEAVVEANADSPWQKAWREDHANDLPSAIDLPWTELESAPAISRQLQSAMRNALDCAAAELRQIAQGVSEGRYGYNVQGDPTAESALALQRVVAKIVPSATALDPELTAFREYLELVFCRWFIDLRQLSQREANERLRLALIAYASASSDTKQG